MKKIAWFLGIAILLFLLLTYLSINYTEQESGTFELAGPEDLEELDFRTRDSVKIAASTLYSANFLKRFMQGEHYRKTWATPIQVPIAFLDTLKGGLEVVEAGGGKQTHSLEVKAPDGIVYSLRSIRKDPSPLVPRIARTLGLENIVTDGISAQHPYGALVAARLADAAGLLHTRPELYFIPKQKALGPFSSTFGNQLYYLEYETEGKVNWTPYPDVLEIVDTDDLQEIKLEEGKVGVDKAMLVRARLFDLLIGDWDRHAKQWGWVLQRKGDSLMAIPLPGDRDNAFFTVDGVLPNLIANREFLPGVQAFDDEIDYVEGLIMPFDVYFLKKTSEGVFLEQAEFLRQQLSDEVIREALMSWPEEIRVLDGEEIERKIKARRDALPGIAKKFYRKLQERDFLTEPLKGSEDEKAALAFLGCFECPASQD